MSIGVKPVADRVIVEPIEGEDVTKGGVIIPEFAKDKPVRATVLAVGDGRFENGQRVPVAVTEGQVVWFSPYAGTTLDVDGSEFLVLRESDLMAVEV